VVACPFSFPCLPSRQLRRYATSEADTLQVVSKDANMQMAALMSVNPPTAYGLLYGVRPSHSVAAGASQTPLRLNAAAAGCDWLPLTATPAPATRAT